MKGAMKKRQKTSKTFNRNYKNRDAPALKLVNNELEVFVNAYWASLCEMYVPLNIKLSILLMNKYCN